MLRQSKGALLAAVLVVSCGWAQGRKSSPAQSLLDEVAKHEGKRIKVEYADNLDRAKTFTGKVVRVHLSGNGVVVYVSVQTDEGKFLPVELRGGAFSINNKAAFDVKVTPLAEPPMPPMPPIPVPPVATAFEVGRTRDGLMWVIRYGPPMAPRNLQEVIVVGSPPGSTSPKDSRTERVDFLDSPEKPYAMRIDDKPALVVRFAIHDFKDGATRVRFATKSPDGKARSGYFILNERGEVSGGTMYGQKIKPDPRALAPRNTRPSVRP